MKPNQINEKRYRTKTKIFLSLYAKKKKKNQLVPRRIISYLLPRVYDMDPLQNLFQRETSPFPREITRVTYTFSHLEKRVNFNFSGSDYDL